MTDTITPYAGERTQKYSGQDRRKDLERLMAMQEPMERILERLPEDCPVSATNEWIQISSPTREQVLAVISALNAGKWEKKICHADPTKIDYETTIEGISVIIFYAEPPTSCRIEIEEVEIPARRIAVRKLVCA